MNEWILVGRGMYVCSCKYDVLVGGERMIHGAGGRDEMDGYD